MWTGLDFSDISPDESSTEMSIQKEFDVILKHFKKVVTLVVRLT